MKIGISIPGILDGLNNRVGDMFGWSPPVRGLWWVKVDVFNKNDAPQRDFAVLLGRSMYSDE